MQYFVLMNPEREEYFDPPVSTYEGVLSGNMDHVRGTVGAQQALTYLETPVNWNAIGFQDFYNEISKFARTCDSIDDHHSYAMNKMKSVLDQEFPRAGRWATDRSLAVGDYDDLVDPALFANENLLDAVSQRYNMDPDDLSLYQVATYEDSPYQDITEAVQDEVQKLQYIFQLSDIGEDVIEETKKNNVGLLERMDAAFSNGLPEELAGMIDTSDWNHDPNLNGSDETETTVEPKL